MLLHLASLLLELFTQPGPFGEDATDIMTSAPETLPNELTSVPGAYQNFFMFLNDFSIETTLPSVYPK